MPPSDRDKIKELEKEIDLQLKRPQREWSEIASNLKKLRRLKPTGELAAEKDRLETRYQTQVAKRIEALVAQINSALDQFKISLDAGNPPKEDWAGQTRTAMEELVVLDSVQEKIPAWKETLRKLERERDDLVKVLAIEQEIKDLWTRAEETEHGDGNPKSIVDDLKVALRKSEGHIQAHYINTPGPKRRLENLREDANRRANQAAQRLAVPMTRAEGELVVTQLKVFIAMAKENPEIKVNFPVSAEPDALSDLQKVTQAIKVAEERVKNFWKSKVVEYTDKARQLLDEEHDPFGAQRELDRCHELSGLKDPEIEFQLPGDSQFKIAEVQKSITAAIQLRNTAEEQCKQALAQDDLSQAVKILNSVVDEFTPSLQSTRVTIRERILTRCGTMAQATEGFVDVGDWRNAQATLTQLAGLLALDPGLNTLEFKTRADKVQRLLDAVKQVKKDVDAKKDPQDGKQILAEFIKLYVEPRQMIKGSKFEEIPIAWEDVRQLRDTLCLQADAKDFLARFKGSIGPGATIERLQAADKDYAEWKDKIPGQYRSQFEAGKSELDARLGYLRAIELQSTDLGGALKALQPALSPEFAKSHPDLAKAAQELRDQVAPRKIDKDEVDRAIKNITDMIKPSPKKAYALAIEWTKNPTLDLARFVELEQEAREAWEDLVTQRINRRLNQTLTTEAVQEIQEGIDDLKAMRSDLEAEYRAKAEFPCALAKAKELEKTAVPKLPTDQRARWQAIIDAWENAYRNALAYPKSAEEAIGAEGSKIKPEDYCWDRRLTALKQFKQVEARTAEPSLKIRLFTELNNEYQESDPEVWLWLGKAHLEMAQQLEGESSLESLPGNLSAPGANR